MDEIYGLDDRVVAIKNDNEEISILIGEYKPFIAKIVSEKVGRYVTYGFDEELSIGMIAFSEAVHSYDQSKGKFLTFAKKVIILRLIDYYRKNKKKSIYLDDVIMGDDIFVEDHLEKTLLRLEIFEFKKELESWGITLKQLVEIAPKKNELRKTYIKIAEYISDNTILLEKTYQSKRLPIKEIEENLKIHRKKCERGRRYIVALIIIKNNDYAYLDQFISWS